jgi:hypothetical protein
MSSGVFETGRYASNETGLTHGIRVQPETKALLIGSVANDYSAVTTLTKPNAQVGRGKKSIGINARTVTIQLTAALSGYKVGSNIVLPWFVESTFSAIARDQTGTYLSTACKVVGKSPERVR